jgi:hypothetical protein
VKSTASKFAASLQTPVYPQTLHQFRPDPKAAAKRGAVPRQPGSECDQTPPAAKSAQKKGE